MGSSAKRSSGLSVFAAIAFAVGNMVGAGVFVLSGMVANVAGPAAIISYLLCGVLVSFSALSYSVLASIFPEDGGGYLFVRRMLGKFPGFLTGWAMYLSQPIGISFVLLGLGIYLNLLIGANIDPRIFAMAAILLLIALNARGLSEAGKLEVALVIVKVAILGMLAAVGLMHIQNVPFTPSLTHGESGLLKGIEMVFFAYVGFQVVAMMGGEVKQSSRNVPIAILASIGIVTAVYAGVMIALISANLPSYGSNSVFDASVILLGAGGGMLVSLAAVASTLSSANASIIGASRITLEMAREKQIPRKLARLRNNQPMNSILLVSGITTFLIIYGNLSFIVNLTNVTVLVSMFLVNASAFRLLRKERQLASDKTYFRIPFGVLFPTLGGMSCALILATISPVTIAVGIVVLLSGSVLYTFEDTPQGSETVKDIRILLKRFSRSHFIAFIQYYSSKN